MTSAHLLLRGVIHNPYSWWGGLQEFLLQPWRIIQVRGRGAGHAVSLGDMRLDKLLEHIHLECPNANTRANDENLLWLILRGEYLGSPANRFWYRVAFDGVVRKPVPLRAEFGRLPQRTLLWERFALLGLVSHSSYEEFCIEGRNHEGAVAQQIEPPRADLDP